MSCHYTNERHLFGHKIPPVGLHGRPSTEQNLSLSLSNIYVEYNIYLIWFPMKPPCKMVHGSWGHLFRHPPIRLFIKRSLEAESYSSGAKVKECCTMHSTLRMLESDQEDSIFDKESILVDQNVNVSIQLQFRFERNLGGVPLTGMQIVFHVIFFVRVRKWCCSKDNRFKSLRADPPWMCSVLHMTRRKGHPIGIFFSKKLQVNSWDWTIN